MTWSIRTRLTVWYLSVVIAVLVTGAVTASIAQGRLGIARLDEDLGRTMATLQGVMRTEFGEGLTLQGAADEASIEVVAPGRSLAVVSPDGQLLALWGVAIDRSAVTDAASRTIDADTIETPSGMVRFQRAVVAGEPGKRYTAMVIASLAEVDAQHAEVVEAIWLGVVIALITAGVGGWIIGRQTLKPLAAMAQQARRINEREPRERLTVPHVDDEIGHVATAFNGLLDRLAAALDQQRQFMADASHELRTPVSVVHTAAQVTLSKPDRAAAEYRESLGIVAEQTGRLARIVDAMFFLSRGEAHGMPLKREFVNLDEIVAESVRALRVLADQRDVTVAIEGAQEVGLVADDGLVRRLVGNLLDNAIRHAAPGGRVVASLDVTDDAAVLRITNDGTAIAPADHSRVFERFVRIGQSDGAGLGLPIARWIAERHGGTVALESSVEGRTVFVVTLPREQTPRESHAQAVR